MVPYKRSASDKYAVAEGDSLDAGDMNPLGKRNVFTNFDYWTEPLILVNTNRLHPQVSVGVEVHTEPNMTSTAQMRTWSKVKPRRM